MQFGKLGMVQVLPDTWQYQPWENPLLIQGVKGINPGWPFDSLLNPDTFAKPEVAAAIARVVGGVVVLDPMAAAYKVRGNVQMLAIQRGDVTVNAGAICSVMGDDASKANVRAKSVEISELLGIFPPDEHLAETIWGALFEGK